jgi:putative two-component system response regulator
LSPDSETILIVDDQRHILRMLTEALSDDYAVTTALDGMEALRTVSQQGAPQLVLLDIDMPVMDGITLCARLREMPEMAHVPIIFMTGGGSADAEVKALESGGNDFLNKPIHLAALRVRVENHLRLRNYHNRLEREVRQRTRELDEANRETVERLAAAAEYRDNETGDHIRRIGIYASKIAARLGCSEDEVELIYRASPMHDVGKIGIPDTILLKPGRLNAEEMAIMKTHTTIGGRLLGGGRSNILRYAQTIALSHHERWDGGGYPEGLSGEAIPFTGRITAVCDVYDALVSRRPYKEPWSRAAAVELLRRERGGAFDARMVDAFIEVLQEYTEGNQVGNGEAERE